MKFGKEKLKAIEKFPKATFARLYFDDLAKFIMKISVLNNAEQNNGQRKTFVLITTQPVENSYLKRSRFFPV